MKYLLPCQCGANLEIEPSQAGDLVACACGASVEAPTLRQLRQLPEAEAPGLVTPASSGWGVRQGLLTAGVLLAVVLGGIAWSMWAVEPPAPGEFDPQVRRDQIAEGLGAMTPAEGYQKWVQGYKSLHGFQEMTSPQETALRDILAKRRVFRLGLLIAAGVAALGGLAAFVLLPQEKHA